MNQATKDNDCINYGYWCLRPKVTQTRTETDDCLTIVETTVYKRVDRCMLDLQRCTKRTECPEYEHYEDI